MMTSLMRRMQKPRLTDIFICYTPLHVLISERIIELKKIEHYCLLYFYEVASAKNDYYFNKLKARAESALYLQKSQSLFGVLTPFISFFRLRKYRIQDSYTGNIKTAYSRLTLWLLRPKQLFTMDDGAGNISLTANYFGTDKEKWFTYCFFSIVGGDFTYRSVRKRIIEHYTIYKHSNVFPNCVYVDLFHPSGNHYLDGRKDKITTLLTGALATENIISKENELRLYREAAARFNADLIIMHPRQSPDDMAGYPNVSSSLLIAEHQILELMKEKQVRTIGFFCTTVLLNLPDTVERINVVTEQGKINKELIEFYRTLRIQTIYLSLE